MKLVTRDDIEKWASRFDAKGNLPYLISRLVRATTTYGTVADFPSGSAAYTGGWDGEVTCSVATPYVPEGISLYEIGTESDNKGKADEDYDKRKADTLGFNSKDCVFIFITPRFWKQKKKWVDAKNKEGFWKDVKVYDSVDLEQWLDLALATSRWFANIVGSYPFDGMMTAEEFWEEWAIGPNSIQLLPAVVTAGRDYEAKLLLDILDGPAAIKGIKASTKTEAIAFIIAVAKLSPNHQSERFFSKSLIIDTEANFRGIRINTLTPLNLIPRFEDVQPLYAAVSKNHHVLVPLGADDSFNQETITLPTNDRDLQVKALVASGVLQEDAEKCSRESGRNITILKKLIGFPYTKAKWATSENIREIIPALLIGRWNESFKGDIELIEKISGQKYSDYAIVLARWKNFQESPILQIGESWRLTSPLDLWTNLSTSITVKDFQDIKESFNSAFAEGNPFVEPESENDFIIRYNKKRKFSTWAREGLVQSLILISRLGEGIRIPNLSNSQQWVDGIISDFLNNACGSIWISADHEMPLLSEASPKAFMNAVLNSLTKPTPEIMEMFTEEEGYLHPTSHHTGLLWALEGLAWETEFLHNVSMILLELAAKDPGGKLSNRPMNSLVEIFKPWHYQTLAGFDERMEVLAAITEKQKETGWNLLINLLPEGMGHGVAHPTHKMRWRMFDKNTKLFYTYQESWKTDAFLIDLLLQRFDQSELKFVQIVREVANLQPTDRRRVLDWAKKAASQIKDVNDELLEALRTILTRHRRHRDTQWAMSAEDLLILEEIYNYLLPTDVMSKYIWLFNEHWPDFHEKGDEEHKFNSDNQGKRIDAERELAVVTFVMEFGFEKTFALRKEIKEPSTFGDAMAKVIKDTSDILKMFEHIQKDEPEYGFYQSFVFRKYFLVGFDWIKNLVSEMQRKGFGAKPISIILIPIPQGQELWDFINTMNEEVKDLYWQKMYPRFYNNTSEEKVYGVTQLMEYKRFNVAIDFVYHVPTEIPTNLLSQLLRKCATEESADKATLRGYEIQNLFEELDKRGELTDTEMAQLEWMYVSILSSYGSSRPPKKLQLELSRNPVFFVDVLKWIYKPKDDSNIFEERSDLPQEVIENRAKQGYHLLKSWTVIPGIQEGFAIDEEKMMEWLTYARELAAEAGRLEVADMHIGQVMAQYPEEIPTWPNETVFKALETIGSDALLRNYSAALFNKRGSSSRGAFEGGNIERGHAAYFNILANKYRNLFPKVAEVFANLTAGYLADAKRNDEEAELDKLEY